MARIASSRGRPGARAGIAAFFFASFVYLSLPAARYNFDGVACAIAVELGDFRHLVHGNHLLYGVVGRVWFSLWRLLGYGGPALQSLQVLDSLLGAGGAAVFCRFLLDRGFAPLAAFLGAAGLAVSRVYWAWSLEAQVYPLGAFFLFLAAAEAFREEPSAPRLGLLHAAAVLGHAGHVMFLPAALYLLRDGPRRARYAVVLASTVASAYALAGALWVRPGSWMDLRTWLLGSAALDLEKKFLWQGGYSLAGLAQWTRISLTLWTPDAWAGCAAAALMAAGAFRAWRTRPRLVLGCLLWLVSYAALYLSWEPWTPMYRLTDLAPAWTLILLGLYAMPGGAALKDAVLACGVLGLGLCNLFREALPGSDPARNALLQRSLWVGRETPGSAWVAAEGVDEVYVPYFARRRTLNLRYYDGRAGSLEERLAGLAGGPDAVFAVPESLSPAWREWFLKHPKEETARSGGWTLYKVSPMRRR